jgi:hypothetical protein
MSRVPEPVTDYPKVPGYRPHSTGETAREAAEFAALRAPRHMDRIEADIREHGPSTPKEVSERTGILHQSCRARCSQMGQRRPDIGGRPAIVWGLYNG